MKNGIRFAAVALLVAMVAVPAFAADEVRVGDFYKQIARFRNVAAVDGAGAERALRAQGVQLPQLDLQKVLTQGDIARVSAAMGVRVTTTQPDTPATQGQVEAFTKTFGSDLGGIGGGNPGNKTNGAGSPVPDPNPDKGKSKGHYKSPTEPI